MNTIIDEIEKICNYIKSVNSDKIEVFSISPSLLDRQYYGISNSFYNISYEDFVKKLNDLLGHTKELAKGNKIVVSYCSQNYVFDRGYAIFLLVYIENEDHINVISFEDDSFKEYPVYNHEKQVNNALESIYTALQKFSYKNFSIVVESENEFINSNNKTLTEWYREVNYIAKLPEFELKLKVKFQVDDLLKFLNDILELHTDKNIYLKLKFLNNTIEHLCFSACLVIKSGNTASVYISPTTIKEISLVHNYLIGQKVILNNFEIGEVESASGNGVWVYSPTMKQSRIYHYHEVKPLPNGQLV